MDRSDDRKPTASFEPSRHTRSERHNTENSAFGVPATADRKGRCDRQVPVGDSAASAENPALSGDCSRWVTRFPANLRRQVEAGVTISSRSTGEFPLTKTAHRFAPTGLSDMPAQVWRVRVAGPRMARGVRRRPELFNAENTLHSQRPAIRHRAQL
jgi:hypothetical protein